MKFKQFFCGALVLVAVGFISVYLYRTSSVQPEPTDTASAVMPAVATNAIPIVMDKKTPVTTVDSTMLRAKWKVESTSPNGKYIAMLYSTEEETKVYLADARTGEALTKEHNGNVSAWTPDSTKALVFIPEVYEKGKSQWRVMYYLGTDGVYENTNLPSGTYAAIVSSNGTIVYAKSRIYGSDSSDIWVRESGKEDRILVKGEDNIFIPLNFLDNQKSIIYKKEDLAGNPEQNNEWSVRIDGTELPKKL